MKVLATIITLAALTCSVFAESFVAEGEFRTNEAVVVKYKASKTTDDATNVYIKAFAYFKIGPFVQSSMVKVSPAKAIVPVTITIPKTVVEAQYPGTNTYATIPGDAREALVTQIAFTNGIIGLEDAP